MRINELKVRNFLSHRDTEIVFPSGLTVIVGENGAGKTSLLDAISYTLFKEHSRGAEENLINRKAEVAEVLLKFSAGGREYSIEWRIKRKGRAVATMRELPSNKPILIDAGERSILPEVEKRLGISKEIFMNAVYVRQGEIARLLEAKPAERKRIITELLGIEVLERIWESLRNPLKLLEERHKKYQAEAEPEASLEGELRKTTLEVSLVREKLSKLREEHAKLEEKMRVVEAELRELEVKREILERLRKELLDKEKEIAAKAQQLRDVGERLRQAQEAQEQVNKLQSIYERSEDLSSKIEKQQKRVEECKEKLMRAQALKESITRLEREVKQYEAELGEILRELSLLVGEEVSAENFTARYASISGEIERSIQLLEERTREIGAEIGKYEGAQNKHLEDLKMLEGAVDKCPLCKQPITPHHKAALMERLKHIVEELKDRAEALRRRESELKDQLSRQRDVRNRLLRLNPQHFETILDRIQDRRAELERLVRELKSLGDVKREYNTLSGEMSEMRSRLELLRPTRDEYLKAKGVLERLGTTNRLHAEQHRLESELRAMNNDRERIIQEIERLGFNDAKYKEVSEERRRLDAELSNTRAETGRLEEREKALDSEAERLKKELQKARAARRKADALAREISLLQAIRECFGKDGVQRVIRSVARRSLEAHARRFLQSFNIIYSDIRLDDDYNIYLYGPDGEQPIESLSGGEKIAVALSLRLGIAAALAGERMECIIMDEPTIHLDSEKRRELVKLLAGLRRERGLLPQGIIVTHDREVEEVADQVYELTRREGYSHILQQQSPTSP